MPGPSPTPHLSAKLFSPQGELRASILAGVLLLLGVVLARWPGWPWAAAGVWASLAIGMVMGGRAALASLRGARFDIDVLMIVGAALSAFIGHPGEGALLLFLFVLSGALEDLAMQRTERDVRALHALMPTDAMVFRGGDWVLADAASLTTGERVKVRPGERVPADARVEVGESSLDQSAITGESVPRAVGPGDELFAGTINTDDPLEATVLRPASESSLQKILSLVTTARAEREPVQRLIDRLDQPYAIGVLVVSTAVALVWWLALHRPLVGDAQHPGALMTAITLLIVASPCALVIATPTATLAGIARGARGGVLFKGGRALEQLARARAICLDKTGTLTYGRPRVYEVHPVAWSIGPELLALAAALEADSTHPIAVAIREAAAARSVEPRAVTDITHVVARGIEGRFEGRPTRLGSLVFTEPLIPTCFRNRVRDVLARIQHRGHIGVVVAIGPAEGQDESTGQVAVIIMSDSVRPGAATLTADLHALDVRPVRMLTGDNKATAERVAGSIGLDAFDAELLPADKLRIVHEVKAARGAVAFVGDGVNDAPALAASDVSLAIGTIGTAAALESADIVLLSEGLSTIPWAIRLARRARLTITINFLIAISIIVLMGLATLAGSLVGRDVPLAIGVLAHEGGTLLVVLNSLLILAFPSLPAAAKTPVSARAHAENTGVR